MELINPSAGSAQWWNVTKIGPPKSLTVGQTFLMVLPRAFNSLFNELIKYSCRMGRRLFRFPRPISAQRSLFSKQLDHGWQVGLYAVAFIVLIYLAIVGRCVLASLNSNMEVSLWVATNNHLKGEWIKASSRVSLHILDIDVFCQIQDVTAFLSEHVSLPENRSSLTAIFQAQTTSSCLF